VSVVSAAFEAALREHLDAIRARDLDALAATVDPDDVVLVAANGEVASGREEFLRRHAEWFRSRTWSIETETLHVREAGELATALLRLRYRDRPPGGSEIDEPSVLALVFRRRDGRWRMVQDQNTPIR
jgi:uncharacterized protein (TIGR02246 family)